MELPNNLKQDSSKQEERKRPENFYVTIKTPMNSIINDDWDGVEKEFMANVSRITKGALKKMKEFRQFYRDKTSDKKE